MDATPRSPEAPSEGPLAGRNGSFPPRGEQRSAATEPPSATDPAPTTLHVRAGSVRVALAFDVVGEQADPVPVAPVPGAAPWCLGLVQLNGRLVTLIDAGRLFGSVPTSPGALVRLEGLEVETALAVDEIVGLLGDEDLGAADFFFDRRSLAAHAAFQAGAAAQGSRTATSSEAVT